MARHLDLAPASGNASCLVDQERRALDAHVLAAVHRLLDPHAVGVSDRLVVVGGETHSEVVLFAELLVAFDAVGRYADHLDAGLAKIGCEPGEILGFHRAAGGVVLGIEIEHDRLAFEAQELDLAPLSVGSSKSGALSPSCSMARSLSNACASTWHVAATSERASHPRRPSESPTRSDVARVVKITTSTALSPAAKAVLWTAPKLRCRRRRRCGRHIVATHHGERRNGHHDGSNGRADQQVSVVVHQALLSFQLMRLR